MIITEVINEGVEIDLSLVPAVEMELFIKSLYEGALRFYENPENMRRYEKWEKERHTKSDGS